LTASSVWAIKNICPSCNTIADPDDIECRKCNRSLNQCLSCGNKNYVSTDYCTKCHEPLAEMRVLASIDQETRDDLRLGESDRAKLESELGKLDHLLESDPQNAHIHLYQKARIYRKMNFAAREAMTWQDYLLKFPDSPKKGVITIFQSEALRRWGYIFYQQSQKPQALEKFAQAVKANPMNAEAWLWIGRTQIESNAKTQAGDAYLEALKARPGDKTAISALRKLKRKIPAELLKPAYSEAPKELKEPTSPFGTPSGNVSSGHLATSPIGLTTVVGIGASHAGTASTTAKTTKTDYRAGKSPKSSKKKNNETHKS